MQLRTHPPVVTARKSGRFTLFGAIAACSLGLASSASAATLLVDFGKNNTLDGIAMASPDSFGHYWNNAIYDFNLAGGAGVGTNPLVPSLSAMIDINNVPTAIGLTFSTGWQANGFRNGGLTTPEQALLGDFASPNATGDYFFFDTSAGSPATVSMTFTGLNLDSTYDFKMFATRNTTETRRTLYSITDINGLHTFDLATSGTAIGAGGYNGNNNTFAFLEDIVPSGAGTITLVLDNSASTFAYIGDLQVTETVPEPGVSMGLLSGMIAVLGLRRNRSAKSPL